MQKKAGKPMKVSLVVPCFNEAENVQAFAEEARSVLAEYEYEIIFVNDGSTDQTLAQLQKLRSEKKENMTILDFSRNFGKEAAIYAGMKHACGEYVSFIDADLQQPVAVVKEMVDFLDQDPDYDAVAAYQGERIENPFVSWLKKRFYKTINKLSDVKLREDASDFRTMRRCVIDAILQMPEYFRFSKGIFSWVGYPTYYRPYTVRKRHAGKTSWSLHQLFRYALDGVVSFSTRPLKIAIRLGVFTSAVSILYMIVVIIQKLFFGIDVPGYPTLVILILLIGGVQLTFLGIMGEYLARIHIEVKHRPIYLMRQTFTSARQDQPDGTEESSLQDHADKTIE